jgi:hypothetical protein
MELEKLKEIWTSLDDRMQQQEGLKTAIIKEMLLSKSDKALSRLINYGFFSVVSTLCLIPLVFWVFMYGPIYRIASTTPIFMCVFILSLWILISGSIGLIKLHKIDFSKTVSSNITEMNKYKIFLKRSTQVTKLLGVLIFVLCFITFFLLPQMEPWRMVALIFAIPVAVMAGYWEYKRFYIKNINSILKSLEELKELEEEAES